ncbi:MAG TPA: TolC family protein [Puia sp.]|nr:TolC family protein [Puia sp.]
MQRRKIWAAAASGLLLFFQHSATAQTQNADSLISQISSGPAVTYTIQQCIDSALKNNSSVQLAEFTARTAQNTYIQSLGSMLPSATASGFFYNNGGKSVNPVTYTYINENFNQAGAQVQGSWTLFNGFSLRNFAKQYSLAYEADKKDWQYQKDLITITVIQDYLAILGTEEQLSLATQQATDIRHRVNLMTIQDSLGSIAHSLLTDALASLNSAELTIVTAKNSLEQLKLRLSQDMNIPYSPNMDVAKLTIDTNPILYNASVDQVYQNATHHIASVQAAALHLESAQRGVAAARGALTPSLYLFYGLYTNYSSAASTTTSLGTTTYQDGSYVDVNGVQTPVNYPTSIPGVTKGVPLSTQFKNNLQKQIGLQLNVPILNGLRYRVAYRNSQISLDQARFNQKMINNNLRQAVEANYVAMVQNFRTYNVTYHQVQNYEESFREAQIKYDNGALSSLDFVIYNTNKNNAELNLISAKYSYLLATKVLDYYQGQLTW